MHGVNQPGVNAQHLAEALGDIVVVLAMQALAAYRPARVQRRQQVLLVQVFQNTRGTCRQIVVEQNCARVKPFETNAALGTNDRLQCDLSPVGQIEVSRDFDVWADGPQAHVEARRVKNAFELRQVAQVRDATVVVVRHQHQVVGLGADLFQRGHGGLHRQWQHVHRQVVPAAGVKVGVHRRELEARIAKVHTAVERWRVLHPFEPEPALDGRHRVEHALLQLVRWAGQGGYQMGNHGRPSVNYFGLF